MTTFSVLLDLAGRSSESSGWLLSDVVGLGVRAEQVGFDRVWLRAGFSAETAFLAGALLGRTRTIGLGLVVPARPNGMPRRQARRAEGLIQRSQRELVVGLLAGPERLKVAAFAGREGFHLLCSQADSSLLPRADQAFRDGVAFRQRGSEEAGHLGLIFRGDDGATFRSDVVRARISTLLAVLDNTAEIVVELGGGVGSSEAAAMIMERWSREILPHFRPLPLTEPPIFV